jgi:cytochrome c
MNVLVRRFVVLLLAAGLIILAALPVNAGSQPAGNAADGAKLIDQWCAQCHLTGDSKTASDTAPAFESLMNDPSYTDAQLRTWLSDPHPPMPKIDLTRLMIRDVIAYLSTLKRP